MVLRWVAASVLEAAKGFRLVQGCQEMPALVAALRARYTSVENVGLTGPVWDRRHGLRWR